jgi:hypothetical protein
VLAVIDEVTDETALSRSMPRSSRRRPASGARPSAVVADEMKALANRVQEGAKEIDGLVGAVQQERRNAVTSIERGATSVHQVVGSRPAGRALARPDHRGGARERRPHGRVRAPRGLEAGRVRGGAADELVRQSAERIRDATGAQDQGQRGRRPALRGATSPARSRRPSPSRRAEPSASARASRRCSAPCRRSRALASQAAAHQGVADVVKARAHTHAHEESAARLGTAAAELAREAESLQAAVQRFKI